ncbi:MAG: transglycosylase SLT domain-containing protein [Beijerinckiaceae bacterium]
MLILLSLIVFVTSGAATLARDGAALRKSVARHAAANGVPPALAHAVVVLESTYRPSIVHKGNYGLMQIRLGTARAMGFRGGPRQLLQPDINLRYGMKYLARAWKGSGGNVCGTIHRYRTGFAAGRLSRATLTYCARAKRLMAKR